MLIFGLGHLDNYAVMTLGFFFNKKKITFPGRVLYASSPQ